MGENHLESSGFKVAELLALEDQKLAFSGPPRSEVPDAWRTRFERMKLLRDFCGSRIDQVQAEFLGCLMHAEHRSEAKVICCIATKFVGTPAYISRVEQKVTENGEGLELFSPLSVTRSGRGLVRSSRRLRGRGPGPPCGGCACPGRWRLCPSPACWHGQ